MEGMSAPVIFPADLIVRCSPFLSCLVADLNQSVWSCCRTGPAAPLESWTREVHPLLGPFLNSVYVGGPLQVLCWGIVGSQNPEGVHSRQCATEDCEGRGNVGESLLKASVISTVLRGFSSRMLWPRQGASCSTVRLHADSTPPRLP